jgi:hypothetical protein
VTDVVASTGAIRTVRCDPHEASATSIEPDTHRTGASNDR